MTISAFTTRYYYTCVLMREKGKNFRRTYSRKSGVHFGISPSSAATAIEKQMNRQDYLIESITLRLSSEDGEIVLQTDIDLNDQRIEGESRIGIVPKIDDGPRLPIHKPFASTQPDHWKYLTFVNMVKQPKPKFNVKEHMK